LLGFYLDDRSTDLEGKRVIDFLQSVQPGRSECIMKTYTDPNFGGATDEGLAAYGNVTYVNDRPVTYEKGLQEGIRRVFAKSPFLAAPFNEFTSYDRDSIPDEAQYVRRLHWGALQAVMAQTPWHNADPWRAEYSSQLVGYYRYYAWLHWELVPYLYSYAYNMHEHPGEPVFRQPDAASFTTRLGDELFVAYVTSDTTTLDVSFPEGTWIDYWDEARTYEGGTTASLDVPLGREPIFIRDGSILPMRVERAYTKHGTELSAGALTVVVFPGRPSTFRYRDHASGRWITFESDVSVPGNFAVGASEPLGVPILYRIERQANEPTSVRITAHGIAFGGGNDVPRLATEQDVEGSATSAWTYDGSAKRVIVKVVGSSGADAGLDVDRVDGSNEDAVADTGGDGEFAKADTRGDGEFAKSDAADGSPSGVNASDGAGGGGCNCRFVGLRGTTVDGAMQPWLFALALVYFRPRKTRGSRALLRDHRPNCRRGKVDRSSLQARPARSDRD
jgi:hypothetical protein